MPAVLRRAGVAMLGAVLALPACGSGLGARDQTASAAAADRCTDIAIADARCTSVAVSEDRRKPAGRRIQLRVVTLPARESPGGGRAADPIFVLAGGPGQAASTLAGDPAYADPVIRRRDVVFVDQRGTGGSNGLLCQFYGPDPQSYFDAFLPIDKVRACRDTLASRADLSQYTTAASVDDLDEVRAALGYDRLNLIGGSYGTRLAMEYLRRHGDRVRSVVLDGPVAASVRIPEDFGRLAQRSLDLLLDECVADAACASRFGDIRAKTRAVFERLRRGPVEATVVPPGSDRQADVTLTRNHVAEAIRYMTYSAGGASRVPLVLHEAARGNFGPIAQFLLRWRSSGTFEAIYLSITCAEDVPFVGADAADRDDATYLGGYRVREQRAACAEWPRGSVPAWHGQPVESRVPALVLSGELDPVTPSGHGDEIARTVANSLHVRVPFAGHSPNGLEGLACLDRLVGTFIEAGSIARLDVSCVSDIRRPGFAAALSR